MAVQMIIEFSDRQGIQATLSALETHKRRLRASIERTRRRLLGFEEQYKVSTARFLSGMTAEDLSGGDLEYVEWAGEARLLKGLEEELRELEDARVQLP